MKKIAIRTVIGVVVSFLLLWFGGRWLLSFSTAAYSGEIRLKNLAYPVEVTFDGKGIPQIWAETDADMFFTLGWLHASERLFQMEMARRFVRGELSELLGEETFELDRQQRRIGFARRAAQDVAGLSPEAHLALLKYCEGINAWVAGKTILPPEFVLLGISPRPWRVEDCLGLGLYQCWYAHSLMDRDRQYQQLVDSLGGAIKPLLMSSKTWSPATVPSSFLKQIFPEERFPGRMTRASNSWVVAPRRSASGAALHASDPHLEVHRVPGFWYIAGLHSRETTDVLGVTVPGLPLVIMGHNGTAAYAFTVAAVDVIDYYQLQRHPRDSLQVLLPEGYQPLRVLEDSIRVKGIERPRRILLCESPYGPVVERDSATVMALRWVGFDFDMGEMMTAGINLHDVQNFSRFRRFVTRFGALNVNWTYSDRQGNIGYQLGTALPRRTYANTFAQLAGEDSQNRWGGYYPLDETPYAFNPERGWLATCNNRVVPEDWPFEIPGFYDPYRIPRAAELLEEKAIFSATDLQKMQLDQFSGVARRWKGLLVRGAERLERPALAAEIRAWDGLMSADSKAAALFRLWWEFLSKALFEDELGDEWKTAQVIQEEILTGEVAQVIDDRRSEDVREDAEDVAARGLQYVLDTFGRPKYGDINKLLISHPLARVKLLDLWLNLNRGPFPSGGDRGTLDANYNFWIEDRQQFLCAAGPSMRFVLDWADVDGFTINGNLGQSGNVFSPHYDDFLETMRTGKRWIVPFSREKVYQERRSLLRLIPDAP